MNMRDLEPFDDSVPEAAEAARSKKRAITIDVDQLRMVNEAVLALVESGRPVYQRATQLVRVVREADRINGITIPSGAPIITAIRTDYAKMLLSDVADWQYETKGGDFVATTPPGDTVRQVLALGFWDGIRPLHGIAESPFLRQDGTVLEIVGYDEASGMLYAPNAEFLPVASQPSRQDAQAAARELLDAVADFPFAGPEHKSAWIAAVITMISRPGIDGCAPISLVEGTERGTGKGLAVETACEIAYGRTIPVMPQTTCDEETRKRITSIAMSGVPAVLLDNLTSLGGSVIDAALTATVWEDRLLGGNRTVRLPLRLTWLATGNNVELRGDAVRRINLIRLEANCERPEERSGFKHDPLIPWVRRMRPRLLRAALTIVRAYFAAGCPRVDMPNWGRFEEWSRYVRAPLIWIGLPDPYLTRAALYQAASQEDSTEALFRALRAYAREHGTSTRQTFSSEEISQFVRERTGPLARDLRDALIACRKLKQDATITPSEVGYALRALRGKVRSGLKLSQTTVTGDNRWYLDPLTPQPRQGGDGGDGGDASPRPEASPPSPPSSPSQQSEFEWEDL